MPEFAPLLLDTHAWIWLIDGHPNLSPNARRLIDAAASRGDVLISAISVWEVGMLVRKGRLALAMDCRQWVSQALSKPGVRLVPISAEIALDSCFLPATLHEDPADRLIVACAIREDATILTHDMKLLAYGRQGHVSVKRC
ncbi:MAG TPA: type II toxin-antitoxin system VapC family toxin [Candidatus Obscuribacterales bacterium]